MLEILEQIVLGKGREEDLAHLEEIARFVKGSSQQVKRHIGGLRNPVKLFSRWVHKVKPRTSLNLLEGELLQRVVICFVE